MTSLAAEAEERLDQLVGVPDPQLVQLVDLVELDTGSRRACTPVLIHIWSASVRVLVPVVEAGAVDGVLRSHAGLGVGRGGGDGRDRIGVRLHGETPHVALEDGVVGGRIDLVDSPVVGPARRPSRPGGSYVASAWSWLTSTPFGIGPAGDR